MLKKAEKKVHELPLMLAGKTRKAQPRTVLLRLAPSDYKIFAEALVKHGAIKKGRGLLNQEKALMKLVRAALEPPT